MKITVEFSVVSDPPMPEEDMRAEFLFNLQWFVGIIPTPRGTPVVEVVGFRIVEER